MTDEEKKALEMEQAKLDAKMQAIAAPAIEFAEKMKGVPDDIVHLKTLIEKGNDSYLALQKQYDELDIKLQKANVPNADLSVKEQLTNLLRGTDFLKDFKASKRGGYLDLKGVDIMNTKVTTRVTDTIAPQFTPLVTGPFLRHIRDFLPVTTTTAPHIWMPYMATETNNAARVAENGLKPTSVVTPSVAKFPIEKLATIIVFSEEMLEDMPGFAGYILSQWIEKLKRVEDTQLLYGTGSSQLYGLTHQAAAYVDIFASAAIDRYMVIDGAATQVQTAGFQPNFGFVHPKTLSQLRETRGTHYDYVRAPGDPIMINGVQMIPHASMVAGDFLVGDFSIGAQIYDRVSANVRFYDQDSTNAQYNLITAVIEERLALVTYHDDAFVYGTFGVALAQGSA